MKKRRIIITCLLGAAFLTAGVLSGCAGKKEPETPTDERVVLYDFEKGTASVHMALQFGKIEANEAAEQVKEGKRSLKLQPSNVFMNEPYAYFPFESGLLGFSYKDLLQMPEFTMDVYSTMDTTMNVGVYFSKTADVRSASRSFTLKKGWNAISYEVDYGLISIQYSLEDCQGLYVSFDGTAETMPVVYLDNLQFKKEQMKFEEEDLIRVSRTENTMEICDFERAYQSLACFAWNTGSVTPAPEVSVVRAADCGITAMSGEKMMKLRLYPRASGESWTLVGLTPSVMKRIDFTQFAEELEQWTVKFDVYQAGEDSLNIGCDYLYGSADSYHGNSPYNIPTVKGEWVEYSYSMDSLTDFAKEPYTMAISWFDPAEEGDYLFYIDNIRLEKKSSEGEIEDE